VQEDFGDGEENFFGDAHALRGPWWLTRATEWFDGCDESNNNPFENQCVIDFDGEFSLLFVELMLPMTVHTPTFTPSRL
jgi:hypothetical protein